MGPQVSSMVENQPREPHPPWQEQLLVDYLC